MQRLLCRAWRWKLQVRAGLLPVAAWTCMWLWGCGCALMRLVASTGMIYGYILIYQQVGCWHRDTHFVCYIQFTRVKRTSLAFVGNLRTRLTNRMNASCYSTLEPTSRACPLFLQLTKPRKSKLVIYKYPTRRVSEQQACLRSIPAMSATSHICHDTKTATIAPQRT